MPCFSSGKSILYIDYALVLGIEFGLPFSRFYYDNDIDLILCSCYIFDYMDRNKSMYDVNNVICLSILTIFWTGRDEINPLTTVLYRDGELPEAWECIQADAVLAITFSSIRFGPHFICIE